MFKHTIEYTDFNGMQRKEDFYFHLSLPEVIRIEAELGGVSIEEYTRKVATDKNLDEMLKFIEKLILNSYGKKTSDGKSFHKSKELREEFEYSQAYAELFEEMLTSPDLARKFGAGVVDNGKAKKNQVTPQVVSAD